MGEVPERKCDLVRKHLRKCEEDANKYKNKNRNLLKK
jgi:hypothetical protein